MNRILRSLATLGGYIPKNNFIPNKKINIKNLRSTNESLMSAVFTWRNNFLFMKKKAIGESAVNTANLLEANQFSKNTLSVFNFDNLHSSLAYFDGESYSYVSIYKNNKIIECNLSFSQLVHLIDQDRFIYNCDLNESKMCVLHHVDSIDFDIAINKIRKKLNYNFLFNNCSRAVLNIAITATGLNYYIPKSKILLPSQAQNIIEEIKNMRASIITQTRL